jgi:hypothetical protein
MTQLAEELKPRLAQLPSQDRAELATFLLSSLDDDRASTQAEIDAMGELLASLRRCSREERHARLRQLADEAMADPRFVADTQEIMHAFRHVDAEGWPDYD